MKVKEPDLTEQIREIFGTTDAKELRRIAEDAACYRKKGNSANRSPVGRKNSFTDPQLANILALQKQGVKITEIAKKYHVSRQTIYSQIKRVHNFSEDPDVKMRMYFMNRIYSVHRNINTGQFRIKFQKFFHDLGCHPLIIIGISCIHNLNSRETFLDLC